tara:strand:+ start:3258 stop:4115 length:858 start_codon:yes stop_codon:yes gene_type:complete
MANILALAGKKQSGKNTSANWLLGIAMCGLHIVEGRIDVDDKGRLRISDMWGNQEMYGVFDYYNPHPEMTAFLHKEIHPWYRIYSFADLLKRDVCMGLLGLEEKQCFGTDEEKMAPTHLLWENMPGVTTNTNAKNPSIEVRDALGGTVYHEPGLMTGRDVMQFVGTDVFRKMHDPVWARGTLNRIKADKAELSVICDCRFPNEVEETQAAGGKVVRFLRDPYKGEDQHSSETALDPGNFDQSKFDLVIDNSDMTILEQNNALYPHLVEWGFIELLPAPKEEVLNG